jgi:hypothetical protein
MDQSGVSSACLVAANIERNPDNNVYIAACVQKYPGRLHHIAHIDCFWEPTYAAEGAADRLSGLVKRFHPAGTAGLATSIAGGCPALPGNADPSAPPRQLQGPGYQRRAGV